jgi:hypothetical protein
MRILLTGARAPATLELARLACRAGHEVHVADSVGWHICRGSRLIARHHRIPAPRTQRAACVTALNAITERFDIECIVPTCEELFHLAAVRSELRARVTTDALPVLRRLHDKWTFLDAAHAAGLVAPRSTLLQSAADLVALSAGEYILKPRFSRFATRTVVWRRGDPVPDAIGADADAWIAQERLAGATLCTWSIVHRGRVLVHAAYGVNATAGERGAAIDFTGVAHAGARRWVERFAATHQLSGQFAFDFIDGPAGLLAIECNPRLTSGVHLFRDDPSIVASLLAPDTWPHAHVIEPPAGRRFRSRLALLMYGHRAVDGAGLLDARDDPWPQRLQVLSWAHLLVRAAWHRTDPRLLSTRDIEWNGE